MTARDVIAQYIKYGERTLSSGEQTNIYFDLKELFGDSIDSMATIEELRAEIWRLYDYKFSCIGGVEFGGIPIAAMLAMGPTYGETYCYIRKRKQDHGMEKSIEGKPAITILLVDDVIRSGKSITDAWLTCVDNGLTVVGVMTIIDRMDPVVRQKLEDRCGFVIHSLYREADFKEE